MEESINHFVPHIYRLNREIEESFQFPKKSREWRQCWRDWGYRCWRPSFPRSLSATPPPQPASALRSAPSPPMTHSGATSALATSPSAINPSTPTATLATPSRSPSFSLSLNPSILLTLPSICFAVLHSVLLPFISPETSALVS